MTQVAGAFDGERWHLSGSPEASSLEWRFGSTHEHYHLQLQNTSAWGALVRIMNSFAEQRMVPPSFVAELVGACESVQEAFATWMATTVLTNGDEALEGRPTYSRWFRSLDRLVADVDVPYLRVHAALAIASVAMQGGGLHRLVRRDLSEIRLQNVRSADRPDERFKVMRRQGLDFTAIRPRADEILHASGHPAATDGLRLTGEMFDASHQSLWFSIHELYYESVAEQLATHSGCRTLEPDEHETVAATLARHRKEGAPSFGFERPMTGADASLRVLRDVERESFSLDIPRHIQLLGDVDPASVTSGEGADEHYFITIRNPAELARNYDRELPSLVPGRGWQPYLRRTWRTDAGDAVQLLPLRDDQALRLASAGTKAITLVPLSLQAEVVESSWRSFITPGQSVILLDVPLADQLPHWLSTHVALRGQMLHAKSLGAKSPILVCRLFSGTDPLSHLMVRALSPHSANSMLTAANELTAAGWTISLDTELSSLLGPGDDIMLAMTLAHLVGEERVFGPL